LSGVMMRTVSIAGDGAGGFWKFCGVDRGGERLRTTGGRLQDKEILRGANIGKKFAEGREPGEGKPLDSSGSAAAAR